MSKVTITVNAKRYDLVCEDGKESHLAALASIVDARIAAIASNQGERGQARDAQLFLMAALTLADEIQQLQKQPSSSTTPENSDESSDDHQKTMQHIAHLVAKIEAL